MYQTKKKSRHSTIADLCFLKGREQYALKKLGI